MSWVEISIPRQKTGQAARRVSGTDQEEFNSGEQGCLGPVCKGEARYPVQDWDFARLRIA